MVRENQDIQQISVNSKACQHFIFIVLSYLISYQTMFFVYVNKGGSFGEIYMGVGPNLEKVPIYPSDDNDNA